MNAMEKHLALIDNGQSKNVIKVTVSVWEKSRVAKIFGCPKNL